MSVTWCNRNLFISPIYYALCTSERDFHKECERLKVPRHEWPKFHKSSNHAATHWFEKGDGRVCAVVTLAPEKGKQTGVQIAALLVHEASHIWRGILAEIGEKKPCEEFEAYALQAISQDLMNAYLKQKKVQS